MVYPSPLELSQNQANIVMGRGYRPYIDVNAPDNGCAVIIKSPADTSTANCGFVIGTFKNPVCAVLNLEKTFMVQFCCGQGDCDAAGANSRRATLDNTLDSSGLFSLFLRDPNGTMIQPLSVGSYPSIAELEHLESRENPAPGRLLKRSCDKKSWVADAGKEDYTKPSDSTQVVMSGVRGESDQTITKSRTQEWTSTLGGSVGFEDLVSIGLSFEESFSESITDSKERSFHVDEGQQGDIGFTAYLRCSTGKHRLLS